MLKHVLIIPDGNRRYAKEKGLSYKQVYDYAVIGLTTKLIKFFLLKKNLPEVTVYGMSRKNVLNRRCEEIAPILESQIEAYKKWLNDSDFKNAKVGFTFIGDIAKLPSNYQKMIRLLEYNSSSHPKKCCNILVAYDAEFELIKAIKKVNTAGRKISKNSLSKFLLPKRPIDLVFRTGFEKRLSGAPLIQSAQAELIFTDYYYPELDDERMEKIIVEYNKRERRFGK